MLTIGTMDFLQLFISAEYLNNERFMHDHKLSFKLGEINYETW